MTQYVVVNLGESRVVARFEEREAALRYAQGREGLMVLQVKK